MFWVYLYLGIYIVIDIILLTQGIEFFISRMKNIAPEVPSSNRMRDGVIAAIHNEFPDVQTVLDIGSGWGGMGCRLAREFPNARVTGIECMPIPFVYSVIAGFSKRNLKFKFGNVFRFLGSSGTAPRFDVGFAYLLTPEMGDVKKILKKFKVLVVADFPLPGVRPAKKIKLHKDMLGQHWLYIYR